METIWTPFSLPLLDSIRTFPTRALFLAREHGHVRATDGRLNLSTALPFFLGHLEQSPLGGVLLGEVWLSPAPQGHHYRGALCHDEARLDEFLQWIDALRASHPEVQYGVHLSDQVLCDTEDVALVARLHRLLERLDWIECEAAWASHLMTYIQGAAVARERMPTLCIRVSVRQVMSPEELDASRRLVHDVASASLAPIMVHVCYARDEVSVHTGGSERASAQLGKIARQIVPLTHEEDPCSMALLVSGRIKHSEDARRVLDFHAANLVGMTRALLAEPAVLARDRRREMSVFCTGCMACVPSQRARFQQVGLGGRECILRPSPIQTEAHPDLKRWLFLGASYTSLTLAEELAKQGHAVHVYTLGATPGGLMRLRGRAPGQAECAEVVLQRLDQCRALTSFHLHSETLTLHEAKALIDAGSAREEGLVLGLLPEDGAGEARGELSLLTMMRAGSSRVAYPELEDDALLVVLGSSLMAVEGALFLQMQGHRVAIVPDGAIAHDTHEAWTAHYEVVLASRKIARLESLDALEEPCYRIETRASLSPHPWEEALLAHVSRARVVYRIEDRYEPMARLMVMGARRV